MYMFGEFDYIEVACANGSPLYEHVLFQIIVVCHDIHM